MSEQEKNGAFIEHLQNEGVVLGEENDVNVVLQAMEKFHVGSSVDAILDAFPTLKEAQGRGTTVHVKAYLNKGENDIKLSLGNVPNGSLINGMTGQPTAHSS